MQVAGVPAAGRASPRPWTVAWRAARPVVADSAPRRRRSAKKGNPPPPPPPPPANDKNETDRELYSYTMDKPKTEGMKSAYELALERLESQGIERPREEGLSEEARRQVAEIRQQAEAKLAELEILHRDRARTLADPVKRREQDEEYVRERRRIEDERERKIRKVRAAAPAG
jgi:hypothetical protein